jgi:hypothetical protein
MWEEQLDVVIELNLNLTIVLCDIILFLQLYASHSDR